MSCRSGLKGLRFPLLVGFTLSQAVPIPWRSSVNWKRVKLRFGVTVMDIVFVTVGDGLLVIDGDGVAE